MSSARSYPGVDLDQPLGSTAYAETARGRGKRARRGGEATRKRAERQEAVGEAEAEAQPTKGAVRQGPKRQHTLQGGKVVISVATRPSVPSPSEPLIPAGPPPEPLELEPGRFQPSAHPLVTLPEVSSAPPPPRPFRRLVPPADLDTFVFSGANGLDHRPLRKLLITSDVGFRERRIEREAPYAGFFCLEPFRGKWEPRAFRFQSHVKSLLTDHKRAATDAGRRWEGMREVPEELRQHVLAAEPLTAETSLVEGEVLLVRTGAERALVYGAEALEKVRASPQKAVVSVMPKEPLLLGGRKMVVRMFLLVRAAGFTYGGGPVPFLASLFNEGFIHIAAEPYRAEDWSQARVHLPSKQSTPADLFFPMDAPLNQDACDAVFLKMNLAAEGLQQLLSTASSWPESCNGFEVFAADFALSGSPHDPDVVLLDLHEQVDYSPILPPGQLFSKDFVDYSTNFSNFSRRYWQWVLSHAVLPFFDTTVVHSTVASSCDVAPSSDVVVSSDVAVSSEMPQKN